jgi:hypothetical protein
MTARKLADNGNPVERGGAAVRDTGAVELVIATNPDPDSQLQYLLRVPLGDGLVFRTSGTWPREKALYCYPVPAEAWPADPHVVERIGLRSCTRRGAAIELVAERGRENRSQLVFTQARGRDAVFWQSPKTRKTARPSVRLPTARAAGLAGLEVAVDSHEQFPYRFAHQQVTTVRRALPAGDYGIVLHGRLVAAVERKSLPDLVSSLTSGKLGYQLADLATLPRAAVVVEDRYSQLFKLERVRPAVVADGLAELAVRWPHVPVGFCETRSLAEEWTYRYLATAYRWASDEDAAATRIGVPVSEIDAAPAAGHPAAKGPSTAEVRAWARANNLPVSDRGRLPPQVWAAWHDAH